MSELQPVARLYETGLKRRYRRASVLPGRGEPLCLLSDANAALTAANQHAEALQAKVESAEKLVSVFRLRGNDMNQHSASRATFHVCADELASAISQTREG